MRYYSYRFMKAQRPCIFTVAVAKSLRGRPESASARLGTRRPGCPCARCRRSTLCTARRTLPAGAGCRRRRGGCCAGLGAALRFVAVDALGLVRWHRYHGVGGQYISASCGTNNIRVGTNNTRRVGAPAIAVPCVGLCRQRLNGLSSNTPCEVYVINEIQGA